ncbi:hypothetical protein Avbf_14140 [Armadillidium vulgare]|nr:hypothetical protein Avbf_14140 [Armadillidium vulgare]
MKNKYLRRKDLLTNKRSEIGSSLEVIENGLAKLNELTDSDSAEIDTRKTKKILTKLEEDYKKSEDFVRFNYWKLRLSVSISLGSFENPEKYLTEFEELKQCINSKNFYTFLKISCNEKNVTHMVITEMFDRHSCNQFIKLCTGECGPSYKDSSYKMGCNNVGNYLQNVLHVEKFLENDCETKRVIEYKYCGDKVTNTFQFQTEQMFLYLNSEGSFDIYRATHNSSTSEFPFGKVISPAKLNEFINYNDPTYLKVVDCGIVFNV